jgi:hypothetical protein
MHAFEFALKREIQREKDTMLEHSSSLSASEVAAALAEGLEGTGDIDKEWEPRHH